MSFTRMDSTTEPADELRYKRWLPRIGCLFSVLSFMFNLPWLLTLNWVIVYIREHQGQVAGEIFLLVVIVWFVTGPLACFFAYGAIVALGASTGRWIARSLFGGIAVLTLLANAAWLLFAMRG